MALLDGMPNEITLMDDAFETLAQQMDQMMDELAHRQFYSFSSRDCWEPAVNVYETRLAYFVCVDLAGMSQEGIDVREDASRLVIRGRRATPRPPEGMLPLGVDRMEIESGPFQRAFEMPVDVDRDKIRARYRDGLLWVTLPRKVE